MPTKNTERWIYARRSVRQYLDYPNAPGNGYDITSQFLDEVSFVDTRFGISNPLWRSIIKSGGNASTQATGEKIRVLAMQPVQAKTVHPAKDDDDYYYEEECLGNLAIQLTLPSFSNFALDESEADNQALTQAYSRLNQQRRHTQGLVFLGELKETVGLFRHPFKSASGIIDNYFKSLSKMTKNSRYRVAPRKVNVSKFLKDASDTWLEAVFGLLPLISDVKGIAETAARFQNDSRRSVIVANGVTRGAIDGILTSGFGNSTSLDFKFKEICELTIRYKFGVDYKSSAEFGSMDRLAELSGLTLQDFIPSIYELIPWSFFVDYFSNLGNIVEAGCTSTSGVAFINRTARQMATRYGTFNIGSGMILNPDVSTVLQQAGDTVIQRSKFSREPGGELGIPSLEISLPGNPMKWANIAALWLSSERTIKSFF